MSRICRAVHTAIYVLSFFDAKSHVGAKGIMQIMPRTFEEIKYKNPSIKGSALQPKWNIAAGIYYDRAWYCCWPCNWNGAELIKLVYSARS